MTYRVRINYDVPGWAYHSRGLAIQKYAPADFDVELASWFRNPDHSKPYDLVFQLPPAHAALRKQLDAAGYRKTLVLGGLNVGYGHHEERLRMCSQATDHIVVNNRDCWERLGKPDGMTWISNGVDLDHWQVMRPIASRECKVLWTGADFHCRKTNIKGWHEVLLPLSERLEASGIDHDFRKVRSERPELCFNRDEMRDWYNTGTIYLCTSSSEGTPNPALEAAACGCTVVTTPVGNMPELIEHGFNGLVIHRSVQSAVDGIYWARQQYLRLAEKMQATILGWNWKDRAAQYYDLFRRLIDAGRLA